MNKILDLLMTDFFNTNQPSPSYWRMVDRVCEVESAFFKMLNPKQRAKYNKLCSLQAEMHCMDEDMLAEYLYEQIKK